MLFDEASAVPLIAAGHPALNSSLIGEKVDERETGRSCSPTPKESGLVE